MLRFSLDAKGTVLLGELSRGGYSRVTVKALDHDYRPDARVTPFGIFLPEHGSLFLYFTTSTVTSDFMVDCLSDCWKQLQAQFPKVTTLVIHQDNGPDCHSRRTQLIKRMVQLADDTQCSVQLAYYPPYHSKYNPIERVWGGLEQHWNGSLLDSVDTVINFATTFMWRQMELVVTCVKKHYLKGVTLSAKAMALLEHRLERLKGLEKWFVTI
jgi:transposase